MIVVSGDCLHFRNILVDLSEFDGDDLLNGLGRCDRAT